MSRETFGLPGADVPELFAGYRVHERIGVGASSAVYRADRDGKFYALKVMTKREGTDAVDIALRFRREASTLARLTDSALVRLAESGEAEGRPYLAMEYLGGGSLRTALRDGPMPPARVIVLAFTLARALSEVHRLGVVHRDLKPENVLFDDGGQPKLIDFGIAVSMTSSVSSGVAGTFLYAAPEQLGVLKRPVDGRSDLYALGALLFECASGRPPFQTNDVGLLIQQHASQKPDDLHELNPASSPAFAAIVAKLLAKDPDDRYQSAAGMAADLERLAELDAAARAGKLVLGAHDRRLIGAGQVRLVGRDAEVGALRSAWRAASSGAGRVTLVEGEGGLGKSRLCAEIAEVAVSAGATLFTSKCQATEQVPFASIREAIDDYIASSRVSPEATASAREAILGAAGDYAPVLKRLSPGLARVIGQVPDLMPADPNIEQDRFFGAVSTFLAELGRRLRGVVWLLDDVQWLDEGSALVLERLGGRLGGAPILILATARTGDTHATAVANFVRAIGPVLDTRIALKPLGEQAVRELVAAHIGSHELGSAFIARLTSYSNGNPFAVGEYVRRLVELGKLRCTLQGWSIDNASLSDVDLPKDVLQLVISRVSALGDAGRRTLTVAAVVGMEWSRAVVEQIVADPGLVDAGLGEALRSNLIEAERGDSFAFIHDRMREAFLAGLSEEERKTLNDRAAAVLENNNDGSPRAMYALARHYAEGHAEKHAQRVFETSFAAGGHALQSYSNGEAYEFLKRAYDHAQLAGMQDDALALLIQLLGIASMLTGRYDDANRFLTQAANQAPDAVARAQVIMLLGYAKAGNGRTTEAWDDLLVGLALLGESVSAAESGYFTPASELERRNAELTITPVAEEEREQHARRRQVLCALYDLGAYLITLTLRPELILDFAYRQLEHALHLGVSDQLSRSYANLALGYAVIRERDKVYEFSERAQQIASQLGDRAALARARAQLGVAQIWLGELAQAERTLADALPDIEKWLGEFFFSIYLGSMIWSQYARGYHRESASRLARELPRYDRAHNLTFSALQRVELFASHCVLGEIPAAMRWREDALRMGAPYIKPEGISEVYLRGCLAIYTAFGYAEIDDLDSAEKMIDDFIDLGRSDFFFATAFVTNCYVALARFRAADPSTREARLRKLDDAIARLDQPAWRSPVYTCHRDVARAARAMETGQLREAAALLDDAEETAASVGSEWGMFEALRERARLEKRRGRALASERSALSALEIANRHGWLLRAKRLKAEFTVAQERAKTGTVAETSSQTSSTGGTNAQRYVAALLEVSLASSSTSEPIAQVRAALDQIIRILAAQRGFLFLTNEAGTLEPLVGRDDKTADLPSIIGYASSIVNKVARVRQAMVVTGTEEGALLGSESAVAHNLRSIIAAPLLLRDELFGVIYLDSTLAKGLFNQDDVEILTAIANHVAIAVDTSRAARRELERQALAQEVQLTGAVQTLFLPRDRRLASKTFQLVGEYRPAEVCSGDWFWWEIGADGSLLVLLGDVTGHGAGPAMVTASVAASYQVLRRVTSDVQLSTVLRQLHDQLRESARGAYTMTFSALRLSPDGVLDVWLAGAPPVIVYDAAEKRSSVSSGPGSPLGSEQFLLWEKRFTLSKGSRIFVFTDGAYEFSLPSGRQFGLKNLAKMFELGVPDPTDRASTMLLDGIDAARKGVRLDDDLTYVVIDYAGPAGS